MGFLGFRVLGIGFWRFIGLRRWRVTQVLQGLEFVRRVSAELLEGGLGWDVPPYTNSPS